MMKGSAIMLTNLGSRDNPCCHCDKADDGCHERNTCARHAEWEQRKKSKYEAAANRNTYREYCYDRKSAAMRAIANGRSPASAYVR
jgi:hypothetical protein